MTPTAADPVAADAPPARPAPSARGLATRSAIIDAALELFLEGGYEQTTMRAIAERAGVSLGNAYYYFASKEHLIQGFYDRVGETHRAQARLLLADDDELASRLLTVLETWIDLMAPYRVFAAGFFRSAADPASPLSPFSAASAPARHAAVELLRETVEQSTTKAPKALRDELPELLWVYQMGMVLYWVHDPSEDAIRTRTLVRRTVPLVVQAIGLAKLPILRSTINELVALIDELRRL